MKEWHITYSVRRLASKQVIVSGGKVTETYAGIPDSSLRLGDALYHIHLISPSDVPLTREDRQEALVQAEEFLTTRYHKYRETLPE